MNTGTSVVFTLGFLVFGAGVAISLACPNGSFSDVDPSSNICHPCSLCNQPIVAAKTRGCLVCAKQQTSIPPIPKCEDGMFLHPAMKICVHCAVCSGTKDEEKWKNSGCDQCVDNSSGIQDPVELNLKADETKQQTSIPHIPKCEDGMFLHPAMKICVHCAVCSGTKDEEKWKTSGCDQCVDNSSGIQDPVELNLKADENEANLSTEGLIAIVAAAGIVIVIIAVVVPLTVFIRCKMKRRQRTGSSQVVTSLVTTGSNPRQTQCITSMTAFANRKQSPPMCTEVTTRINTECLPTQRACAVTIPEEQTANHEESRTSHTPIQEDGPRGIPADDYKLLPKGQCATLMETSV